MGYIGFFLAIAIFWIVRVYYIRSALTTARTFKFYYPTDIVTFDPSGARLPAGADEFIAPTRQSLKLIGFEPAGYFTLSNVKSISMMLVNLQSVESALVNCVYAEEDGGYALKNQHVEFVTRFRDGVCLQTNNSWQIGSFAHEPNDHVVQFWDVQDEAELHRRHQRISEQLSKSPKRLRLIEEFRGDVERYVSEAALKESLEYQVQVGLLRRVADGYVATAKGACVIAWQLQFPWQDIRRWRARRTAEGWLAKTSG